MLISKESGISSHADAKINPHQEWDSWLEANERTECGGRSHLVPPDYHQLAHYLYYRRDPMPIPAVKGRF